MSLRKSDFRGANIAALADLHNQFLPDKYRISTETFERQTVKSPLFDWGASTVISDGTNPLAFAAIKRSAARFYNGPDPDTAHITTIGFVDAEAGVDAIAHVKMILRSRGVAKLTFGQDNLHIFPGCPEDAKQLETFLMVEGFETSGIHHDLEHSLTQFEPRHKVTEGAEFRPLQEADRDSMLAFFDANFPGRWRYDVLQSIAANGVSHCVFGLLIEGAVHGFALLQDQKSVNPIGGGIWNLSLGENWGSLGPIGISKSIRGRGLGGALLEAGLLELKSRGVNQCIIDWTTLVDFYGKYGFLPTRTYHNMSLDLE